jgi:hypothetical protein
MIRTLTQSSLQDGSFGMLEANVREDSRLGNFLGSMDKLMPWSAILQIFRAYYPDAEERHLMIAARCHCVQSWLGIASEDMEEAMIESVSIRSFITANGKWGGAALHQSMAIVKTLGERGELHAKLDAICESVRAASQMELRKGCYRLPELQGARVNSVAIASLSRYFTSISPPYGISVIYRFNAIYKSIYPTLSLSERQQAEAYVDQLIEGLEHPGYAAKIFGVV